MARGKAVQSEEEIQDPIEFSDEIYEARLRLIRQAGETLGESADFEADNDELER